MNCWNRPRCSLSQYADDPTIERFLTPRLALTVAEHLVFNLGHHVLVVLTDMTSYGDAVRQLSAARGEVPSRRGYPGYLFSDLGSIYDSLREAQGPLRINHRTPCPHHACVCLKLGRGP